VVCKLLKAAFILPVAVVSGTPLREQTAIVTTAVSVKEQVLCLEWSRSQHEAVEVQRDRLRRSACSTVSIWLFLLQLANLARAKEGFLARSQRKFTKILLFTSPYSPFRLSIHIQELFHHGCYWG
jgi:hypothetical protein